MGDETEPAPLDDAAVPKLLRGVRMREDPERGWILLAPERVLALDPSAVAVLQEVDGAKSFGAIVDALAEKYAAPRALIAVDAGAFLQDLIDKRMIELSP